MTRSQSYRALLFLLLLAAAASSWAAEDDAPKQIAPEKLAAVDAIYQQAIAKGEIAGAVVLVGHDDEIVYRRAFGKRWFGPAAEPMTTDTVFDMASLTKSLATATSIMRMVELGQLRLNDPLTRFLPECGSNGKDDITLRQLLTHYSGLAPDLDLRSQWSGYDTAIRLACAEKLPSPPGARFVYSDIGYLLLGEIVARVSKMPLPQYADAHIFQPLGMKRTRFLPPAEWRPQIAPTEFDGARWRGVVNDPTARRMGGVAGHAGLFSTADDLARFAQAMLDKKLLAPATIEKMTTPQQPANATVLRGLGWDIDSPFSSNRGELLPVGSYGHTGWAGTSLWIDPYTQTYIIILINRVGPAGNFTPSLRTRTATAVAAALRLEVKDEDRARIAAITGYNETLAGARRLASRNGSVKTGIDVLEETNFAALRPDKKNPRRVAVYTNQTGLDADGRRTVDVLARAEGLKLAAIFSPEHGLYGTADTEEVPDAVDPATGVMVYSLYRKGRRGRITPDLLRDIDAIVFDMQDAGARFYSYEVTLGYIMETAAQAGVEVVVLDRPNPVTGSFVQGPMAEGGPQRLINYVDVPVRHGMTLGELARMYNGERKLGAKLTVVPMRGWQRGDWFDSTGVAWVNPSPNLRSANQATLYPGVALVEGTNVSVGRGTDTPFEVLGAPWIRARELTDYLNARQLPGVRFVPVSFTPNDSKYKGERCQGVNLIVTSRNELDSPELGVELAVALRKLYPNDWKHEELPKILVNQRVYAAIVAAQDPRRIAEDWREGLEAFIQLRAKYLLYK
ncbi:MAG TPA: exo-beta-N-acetylmuramidase NamZ domain-containing protein [Terriglobales bacterium]|nr:exo-beta-N-acetylmuramidase NamZ domain-containing protein [Terriglobales bacterium]